MELIFDFFFAASYLIGNGTFFLMFIGICLHDVSFFEIFQHSLEKLDETEVTRDKEQLLCDLIRFHILVKK